VDSDYRRVEKAILFIEEHAGEQPGLDKVARHVGLSPYHFQRIFKRWTGVSPKRFLQFLTVERAKKLLHRSSSLLNTAFDVGLSGPGRLHDLFLSTESLTPGQFKSGGVGLVIRYGHCQSPFGLCLLAMTEQGICDLRFIDGGAKDLALRDLGEKWKGARLEEAQKEACDTVRRIFGQTGSSTPEPLLLYLRGTNFQIKVWEALLHVPEGAVISYSALAGKVGRRDAVRAVAGAVGSNPIAWLIPCHRVLRSSGEIGGYRWGIARKKMMLARELGGEG